MGTSVAKSDQQPPGCATTLAKPLAPEDVRPGDYVAVLDWTFEVPSYFWEGEESWRREDVVRIRFLPHRELLVPLRVDAACLPFVLAKTPSGDARTVDLRQVRLARLDGEYGKRAWKALKPRREKKGRRKRH
ncbi:MAG: hypothetical protein KDA44_21325 [Planctomycetales bacterium]|nr:hypothetical protein [Planctomycetales bacterium]